MKLMSPKGSYDVALSRIEESDTHFANKERDKAVAATDDVHAHDVSTEAEKRRQLISRQAEHDLEKHQFD